MVVDATYADAAKLLLRNADFYAMKWRQHGLGMLQGELSDELRVHIWHPKLRTIPGEGFRDVHDHRFKLTSYVAFGAIIDVPHTIVMHDHPNVCGWDKYPTSEVHEIVNAKEQVNRPQTDNVTQYIGHAWVSEHEPRRYQQGDVYVIERRAFHTTKLEDLAITLVHRADFDGKPARILGSGELVGSAIVPEDINTSVLREWVLREASYAQSAMR
jgi:hypothetical protein